MYWLIDWLNDWLIVSVFVKLINSIQFKSCWHIIEQATHCDRDAQLACSRQRLLFWGIMSSKVTLTPKAKQWKIDNAFEVVSQVWQMAGQSRGTCDKLATAGSVMAIGMWGLRQSG